MAVVVNKNGDGFGTTSRLPNGVPLAASNTVTVSGVLPGGAGYQDWCLGAAEGDAAIGYYAYLCNTGQWYVKSLVGLGTNGVIVGKQLAGGSFPFSSGTAYNVSLATKPGKATLTISLAQGSGSPLRQDITIGQFIPTAVGYGFENINYTLPINPSYPTISSFIYTAG